MGCSASKASTVVVPSQMADKKDTNNNQKSTESQLESQVQEPIVRQNSGCKKIKVKEFTTEDSLRGSLSSLSSSSHGSTDQSDRESSAKSTRTTDSGLGELDETEIITENTLDSEKLKILNFDERPKTPDLCIQGSQLPRRKSPKEKRVSFGDRHEFEEVKNRINSLAPLGGITERPESRGGLAFDIILCPETGNRKKRPSHLKKLEKRKRKSKKLTKEQLEEKMKNADEKRKEYNQQIIEKAHQMNSRERQVKMALDEFARRQMEKETAAEAC